MSAPPLPPGWTWWEALPPWRAFVAGPAGRWCGVRVDGSIRYDLTGAVPPAVEQAVREAAGEKP